MVVVFFRLSEIGMSCGCLGVLYKPRYKRQVDAIYPRDPNDEKLVTAEMDKLVYYTLQHPEKLDRIGNYLYTILNDGLSRQHNGWVKVSIDAIVELLKPCHAQRINLFISSYLKMCTELLDSGKDNFRLLGTGAFVQFSEKEEDGAVQDHDFSHLIKIFCDLCRLEKGPDAQRCAGIQGLQGVLRKSMEQKQRDELITNYAHLIIPALLFNLDEQEVDDIDDESPRGLADQVLRDLLSRITMDQIKLVIEPLLRHLDNASLWSSERAVNWTQLFMRSVRESYAHLIIKLVLAHIHTKDIKKEPLEIEGVLSVVSQVSSIPDQNTLGTIANELFASAVVAVPSVSSSAKLVAQLESTCGTIISNVAHYIQIEVLESLLEHVGATKDQRQARIILQIMAHCCSSYRPPAEDDSSGALSLVKSSLDLSASKSFSGESSLLLGRILVRLLDSHENAVTLARLGSWREANQLTLAKTPSSHLRKLIRPIFAWVYEQLKMAESQTAHFLVYYQLAGVMIAECYDRDRTNSIRNQLIEHLVRMLLAVQDQARSEGLFEDAVKCQTHATIGATMSLLAATETETLQDYVAQVLNERKHAKPQLTPDSLFSGTSDALRRSTASLYSRNQDNEDLDKFFFNRAAICEHLRAGGFDVSGLTDPLGIEPLETKEETVETPIAADDISLKFPLVAGDSVDGLAKLSKKTFSFTDLLNSYKAVPKTLEELNQQNARSIAAFKRREFHQVVTQIEAEHRANNEVFDKVLSYSSHLQDSGVFVDQEFDNPSLLFCD